jgi:hypothetical protein
LQTNRLIVRTVSVKYACGLLFVEITLGLSEKQTHTFLFAVQGVGAVFVAIFLLSYLGGLPSTAVLHSQPAFRLPLTFFGIALLALVLATIILVAYKKRAK